MKVSKTLILTPLIVIIFICYCTTKKSTPDETKIVMKNDKPRSKKDTTLVKNVPIINIADTVAMPLTFLCVKDSAVNGERLGQKLNSIYKQKLAEAIRKNKLNVLGAPVAWYKTQKAPFFFLAGIAVDKKPGKLPKGMILKKSEQSRIIVAHYYGPYTETNMAYQALKDWMVENKKTQNGEPYEVYMDEPLDKDGNPVDPYKVQTDIIIPYH